MKHLKACAVLLLALVMAFSVTITAAAEETVGNITISGTTEGKVYQIYKIFDLTMTSESASYIIDSDWADFFSGAGAGYITDLFDKGLKPISAGDETRYINITEANAAEFSQAALAYAAGRIPDASRTASGTTVAFTDLDQGYYLIYPQGASEIRERQNYFCSLTGTVPSASVVVRAEYPAIEKTDDAESADVGQTVTYTITGKVPDTTGYKTYAYTIKDVMTSGLTFNKDVKIHIGEQQVGVALDYETISNGFAVTFDMSKWQDYRGQPITVEYTAVVNEASVQEGNTEKNSATLTYDHNPRDNTQKTTTLPAEEKVYSSRIVIDGVDRDDASRKLEGARFVLMNDRSAYYKLEKGKVVWVAEESDARIATTDKNGAASFDGLKNGIYYLKEIQSPDGYNLLSEPVEVTVNGGDNNNASASVVSTVENSSGATLPSTGGTGTAAIYVLGSLLVLGAGGRLWILRAMLQNILRQFRKS